MTGGVPTDRERVVAAMGRLDECPHMQLDDECCGHLRQDPDTGEGVCCGEYATVCVNCGEEFPVPRPTEAAS